MLSSASSSTPRHTSPFFSSTVMIPPSASCRRMIGMPMPALPVTDTWCTGAVNERRGGGVLSAARKQSKLSDNNLTNWWEYQTVAYSLLYRTKREACTEDRSSNGAECGRRPRSSCLPAKSIHHPTRENQHSWLTFNRSSILRQEVANTEMLSQCCPGDAVFPLDPMRSSTLTTDDGKGRGPTRSGGGGRGKISQQI